MSMGYRGKTTNALRERTATQAQMERESAWGELTGKIVSFDPKTQTASIQPDYKPTHNGEKIDMPQLDEVPVRFPRAGGFLVTMPIKEGDKVVLRPQMRSSEKFHEEDKYEIEKDTRTNSLSDMEAFLDGGESLQKPIEEFNNGAVEIRTEGGNPKIQMTDGMIKLIVSDDCYLQLDGNIKLVAGEIDLN